MAGRKDGGIQRFLGHTVRLVLVALAPLILDDIALVVEFGLGQRGYEAAHAVRFQKKRHFQVFRREDLVVVGPVFVRRAIDFRSDLLEAAEMFSIFDVRGPLEHHMLEQMRQPRPARVLILGANVVHDFQRDNR